MFPQPNSIGWSNNPVHMVHKMVVVVLECMIGVEVERGSVDCGAIAASLDISSLAVFVHQSNWAC